MAGLDGIPRDREMAVADGLDDLTIPFASTPSALPPLPAPYTPPCWAQTILVRAGRRQKML